MSIYIYVTLEGYFFFELKVNILRSALLLSSIFDNLVFAYSGISGDLEPFMRIGFMIIGIRCIGTW